jgi:hypothetical protein
LKPAVPHQPGHSVQPSVIAAEHLGEVCGSPRLRGAAAHRSTRNRWSQDAHKRYNCGAGPRVHRPRNVLLPIRREEAHDEPVDCVDVTARIGYDEGWVDARAR